MNRAWLLLLVAACSSSDETAAVPAPAPTTPQGDAASTQPPVTTEPIDDAGAEVPLDASGLDAARAPVTYTNPVLPGGCADPGVFRDDDGTYVLACTSGAAANSFPLFTSPDLVHWTAAGFVFPKGKQPAWTTGKGFWAPEIHKVGGHYVAYFSAVGKDGLEAVGAASATSVLGPYTDAGKPLVTGDTIGVIDPTEITTSGGDAYLIWKIAGLGVGKRTPIKAQKLAADGLSVTGDVVTLITNDEPWEGKSTEGPFVVEHGGMFYLFYSGGIYTNATYAVGVARAKTPHEPMKKLGTPILKSNPKWTGPGHNSVIASPSGTADASVIVYHAWASDCVNATGCQRKLLIDPITWQPTGWPSVPDAPSSTPRTLP